MVQHEIEKRKYPRLDTSQADWKIRVYGVKGRPLEGQILNLSLGGVAFIGHWKKIAKTVKRFTTKVEIQLPNGTKVNANSSLVRIWPNLENDTCVCVLQLTEMNKRSVKFLKNLIPN